MNHYLSENIGKYRQSLMGIGILSVLAVHLYYMGYLPSYASIFLRESSMLVYIEGFLFLSGFGLYYSYAKNGNLKVFYQKRIRRLLIPYILLMGPFIIVTSIIDGDSIALVIFRVLGVSFWIEGNYCSMWYVHVLLLLYLLYPLFHKVLGGSFLSIYFILTLFSILYIASLLMAYKMAPPIWIRQCSFALYRIPFFFLGACVAAMHQKKSSMIWLFLWGFVYVAISLSYLSDEMENLQGIYRMLYYLPLTGAAINILDTNSCNRIMLVLNWFGKYTLEIYIMHLMLMYVCMRIGWDIRVSIIVGETLSILLCAPIHKYIEYLQYGKICKS